MRMCEESTVKFDRLLPEKAFKIDIKNLRFSAWKNEALLFRKILTRELKIGYVLSATITYMCITHVYNYAHM